MAKTVHTKEERQAQFIKIGLKMARKSGVAKVSVAAVAAEAKVTAPLIFHNFGSREKFHEALTKAAKDQRITLPTEATKAPARKRSIAEVKAIKNKVAGKSTQPRKRAPVDARAPKAGPKLSTKAVSAAKKPRAVTKAAAPKAVTKAAKPKAVKAADAPSVSGAFARMPVPKGIDGNLASKP